MGLTTESLWPLVVLAALPAIWWMPARTLTSFNARQLRLQAAVRAGVLVLVAIALAEPAISRSSARVSIVFAVDVSDSVAPEGVTRAARWIDRAHRTSRAAVSHILAFGRDVATVDSTAALGSAGLPVRRDATDVAAAVSAAIDVSPPDSVRRLVLFTDGRTNLGDLAGALARAQREGVRIFTVPIDARSARDTWIESIDAPDDVIAGEPFTVEVTVGSDATRSAVAEVWQAGRALARQPVVLMRGSTRATLSLRLADPGSQALEVLVQADADDDPRNDRRRVAVVARAKPRVLYVESRGTSARYLQHALESGGLYVDVLAPELFPVTAETLDRYAAVIVSDVARRDLNDERMATLDRYVAELGGGLVVVGGEAMYGLEGFAKSQLERTLPVTFKMKDRPDEFAMVVILDKSWSMAGQKIELAKEAAVAALEVLPDRHRFGVITFNDGLEWVAPLQAASNRERLTAAIRAIVPSGHTNLFPAVEEAFQALGKVKADMKHVIVLSDGRTYPDEYEALMGKMVEAKVTVSSVAVGDEADRELLGNLARWGHGRAYAADTPAEVPQIFVKETQRATRSTFVEQPFRPVVRKTVEALAGIDLASAPPLAGYARVQAKDTADVILTAGPGDDDDPILVRWQYGLGRAVVFTSDLKDRWAHDWLGWRGYGKFWTQLVRETMRRDETSGRGPRSALRVTRTSDRARVAMTILEAGGAPLNLVSPRLAIEGPDGRAAVVAARQVGPGEYEAEAPMGAGDYTVRLLDGDGRLAPAERRMLAPPQLERRFMQPDIDLLKAICRDTGGAYDSRPEDAVADLGDRVTVRTPLWPWLAGLAALMWFADLALRRVRLFEQP